MPNLVVVRLLENPDIPGTGLVEGTLTLEDGTISAIFLGIIAANGQAFTTLSPLNPSFDLGLSGFEEDEMGE